MKTYYGKLAVPPSTNAPEVTYRQSFRTPNPVIHHVMYAPDGFLWGTAAGGGATELARCLLIDALGGSPCCGAESAKNGVLCTGEGTNPWAEQYHLRFSKEIIQGLDPKRDWQLNQDEILDWLFDRIAEDSEINKEMEGLSSLRFAGTDS